MVDSGGSTGRSRGAAATLAGKVAVISGGLGDIGREIALELARRGADIALGDVLPAARAGTLLRRLRALRRRCRYDAVDVSDARAVDQWLETVEKELGPPTLIVPNAAVVEVADVLAITPDQWVRQMRVDLDGAFFMAQRAVRRLMALGRPGRVVFVGSWAGHVVHRTIPAYCVAKAGLRMLCQCLAAEAARHGILVNEVAPGYVDAGLSGRLFKEQPGLRDACRRRVPTGRLITAREVAQQVAWLCEPANVHYAGATLLMDGGLSLFGPRGQDHE